ncbi:MAG: N-acetyltransferase [Altererythrobacter sp.]|nr:N-acetyltransferase [Altererythrobacter sp.]
MARRSIHLSDNRAEATITHHAQAKGGRYVAKLAGETAEGYLEWEPRGNDVRVATHTVVPPEIGGRGIAAQLVNRLVKDARKQGFRIVPQCSYVEATFRKNPEWADLRAE